VANGQFLLFRRESYNRIGGHEAVRDRMAEDVALARAIAGRIGNGMRAGEREWRPAGEL
jgi:chlorobactene glucosyltransferase